MSITFDIVTMPPKSQEASQMHVNEINRMNHDQQQVASQFQNQVQHNAERAIRREKAENEQLKNEEREQKKRKKKQNNASKSGSSKEKTAEEHKTGDPMSHFDMKI